MMMMMIIRTLFLLYQYLTQSMDAVIAGSAPGGGVVVEQSLDSDVEADNTVEGAEPQAGSHTQQDSDSSAEEEEHEEAAEEVEEEKKKEEEHPEGSSSSGGDLGPMPVILMEPESACDSDPTPPALPDTEPPELDGPDEGPEGSTVAVLNTNQSNNCLLRIEPPVSPFPKSGVRRLSVYRDHERDGKPEFI